MSGGTEISECQLPLVVGSQKGLVEESDLIIPNMRGIMMARQKPLDIIPSQGINPKTLEKIHISFYLFYPFLTFNISFKHSS